MSAAPPVLNRFLDAPLDELIVRRQRMSAILIALTVIAAIMSTAAMVPVSTLSAVTIGACWIAIVVSLLQRHRLATRVLTTLKACPASVRAAVHARHRDIVRVECDDGESIDLAVADIS
jgi:hypothetical protein